MTATEENKENTNQENTRDPSNDIETIGNEGDSKETVAPSDKSDGSEQKKPAGKPPEEDTRGGNTENKQDPANDIETVTSENDNVEPVPDKEQLKEKK